MDQEKIDRLFREQLHSYEAAPSSKAWESVEDQIGRKKSSPYVHWVAASVAVLALTTWIVLPKTSTQAEVTPIASTVDHPTPFLSNAYVWDLPEIAQPKTPSLKEQTTQPKTEQIQTLVASNETLLGSVESVSEDVLELEPAEPETITEVALVEESIIEEKIDAISYEDGRFTPIQTSFPKVKITYIAAEEKKQPIDSIGGIKKLFAKAGKISPGDVLADLKTAKDNLINNGFRSADKDRASL